MYNSYHITVLHSNTGSIQLVRPFSEIASSTLILIVFNRSYFERVFFDTRRCFFRSRYYEFQTFSRAFSSFQLISETLVL